MIEGHTIRARRRGSAVLRRTVGSRLKACLSHLSREPRLLSRLGTSIAVRRCRFSRLLLVVAGDLSLDSVRADAAV